MASADSASKLRAVELRLDLICLIRSIQPILISESRLGAITTNGEILSGLTRVVSGDALLHFAGPFKQNTRYGESQDTYLNHCLGVCAFISLIII